MEGSCHESDSTLDGSNKLRSLSGKLDSLAERVVTKPVKSALDALSVADAIGIKDFGEGGLHFDENELVLGHHVDRLDLQDCLLMIFMLRCRRLVLFFVLFVKNALLCHESLVLRLKLLYHLFVVLLRMQLELIVAFVCNPARLSGSSFKRNFLCRHLSLVIYSFFMLSCLN